MAKLKKKGNIDEVAVTVSTVSFVRLAILTVSFILLFLTVKKASHALLLIFTALFLALALNAPVYWLSRQLPGKSKGSRSLATSLSFLIVVLALGIFIALIAPPLVKQTNNLVTEAPKLIRDVRDQNSAVGKFVRHYHLQSQVSTLANQVSARLKHAGGTAFTTIRHVGSSAFSTITIFVLTFMMLIEGPRWTKFIKEMVPDKHHKMVDRLSFDMYQVIRGFVNGQVILAVLAALLITPAVFALNISYPAALIVVIFVCGLIPLVGHTIGAVIITTVALFHSVTSAGIILLYYILYMQIEAYIVQPRVQANTTNMSPLIVFISVVVGVSFGGLFGGLVAIPIAGCLRIALLEYLYANDIIDEPKFRHITSLKST